MRLSQGIVALVSLVVAYFVATSCFLLARMSPTELVVGSETHAFRLPRSLVRFWLLHVRSIDPDYRSETGQTLLQMAVVGIEPQAPSDQVEASRTLVRQLIAKGAPVNEVGQFGMTALHDAVLARSLPAVEVLLDAGASPQTKAETGPFTGLTALGLTRSLSAKHPSPALTSIDARLVAAHATE